MHYNTQNFQFRMWINEGFAEYLSVYARWEAYESKMSADKNNDVGCIHYKTPDRNEYFLIELKFVSQMFNIYTQGPLYQMGRSWPENTNLAWNWGPVFVRMLASTVGEEMFRTIMQNYIKKYAHGNVDHGELFNEFENASPFRKNNKISMPTIFSSWMKQKGVPLVRISRCNESSSCKNQIVLKQEHFSGFNGNDTALTSTVWYIPIQYTIIKYVNGSYQYPKNNEVHWFLMHNTSEIVKHDLPGIENTDSKSFALLNINFTGTYHVMYDEKDWKNIGSALRQDPEMFSSATKIQLYWSLQLSAKRNKIKPHVVLCIAEFIKVHYPKIIIRLSKWFFI